MNENLQISPLTASLEHKIEKFREKADNENVCVRTHIDDNDIGIRVIDKLTHKSRDFHYSILAMTPFCENFYASSYRGANSEIQEIMERLSDAKSQWVIESNEDHISKPFKLKNIESTLSYHIWEEFYGFGTKYPSFDMPKIDIIEDWNNFAKDYNNQTDFKIEIQSDNEFHIIVTSTETPITYNIRRIEDK